MKNLITLLIIAFALQSCENKTQKATSESNETKKNVVPTEFISSLRPKEKLELGKIYTDVVQFVKFDDNGDDFIFIVEKNKVVNGLVYNKEGIDFVKGEEIEIRWKMDSIRYAGDPEFKNFTEFLVSAKRLKPLKLTDKKVKFLWREMQYLEDLEGEFNVIVLNEEYIKTISEPEKTALAYVATFIGNECEWDGKAEEDRSNLKCKILWALDLGYQCSHKHLGLLRQWFRNDKNVLKELENCPTTPDGATVQDTFDVLDIEVKDNKITVFFKANGINMREEKSWSWTEKQFFEFKENELILLKKDVSPIERGSFEVRAN